MAARTVSTCVAFVFLLLVSTSFFVYCEDKDNENETPEPNQKEEEATEGIVDDKVTEDQGVLVLNEKNFDGIINTNDLILIEFYAPWCGHCKALAPEFANAAQKLKKNEPPVPLAKVDCTTDKDLCNRFEVQGYPTLILFKSGKSINYDGPREEAGIVKFMKERADPNWQPPPDAVITLTKDNFTEITDREEMMLVEFYAPSCGHCKRLAPELEKAAQDLKKREQPILIAKVNSIEDLDLATKYKVNSYPTMYVFKKGKHVPYKGPRQAAEITEYLINHFGAPTQYYATLSDVKANLKSNQDEPVILGVFESEEDTMYQLFIDSNDEVRDDYKFGHTFSKDVKKLIGLKSSAIVVAHPEYLTSKYEPRYHIYKDASGSPAEVRLFYQAHQVPLVGHYQQHTDSKFAKRPLVLVFYDVNFGLEYRSMTQFWRNKVLKVAKEFPDVLFAVAAEESFEDKLKELDLVDSGEDVNVALYDDKNRRYAMVDEEFSEDSLTEFVEDFLKGKLKPIIKSQAVAPKVKPGKVQVVVGNSFDDIVLDEKKEVFIEFYAPWCGHCKAIESSIVDLAKKLKKEKNIVIAKIDGTANEAPSQYPVSGFPTIYYAVPGKKSKPVLLDGQRDEKSLMKFIEDNSEILKKKKNKEEL